MTFISYAQNCEDLVLWRALHDVEDGFYIDIGAADPVAFSVTHAFYLRGWRGINVEPAPVFFARLMAERTRDRNLNALVGDTPGVADFYEFASLGLSTMDSEVARRHCDAGIEYRLLAMPVVSLTSICADRGALPIHFLKIDVEGAERQVLLSMDFTQYQPWILVVEATEPMSTVSTRDAWESIVLAAGYTFAYFDGLNCFYVAPGRESLIGKLAVPPNVFDEFIRAEDFEWRQQAEKWRLELVALGQQAEEWRLKLLEASQQAEERRLKLIEVGQQGEAWRLNLLEAREQAEERRLKLIEVGQQGEAWRLNLLEAREQAEERGLKLIEVGQQGEAWRLKLLEASQEVEALRLQVIRHHRDAEQWQRELLWRRNEVAALQHQLAASQAALHHHIAVGHAAQTELSETRHALRVTQEHARRLELHLHWIWASFSWRITIPLRSLSRRLPWLGRGLRRLAARHPWLRQVAVRVLRVAWRLVRLKAPWPSPRQQPLTEEVPAAPTPSEPQIAPTPAPAAAPAEVPRSAGAAFWIFLGDTFEWLADHSQLSGVGKVTSELVTAAAEGSSGIIPIPCVRAPTATGLASVSLDETIAYLAHRHRASCPKHALASPATAFPPRPIEPVSGDLVLFSGVIWTPDYAALFCSLCDSGVRVGVLVHDIIPILNPELTDAAFRDGFIRWLKIVLTRAQIVFVSGNGIKDQIERWAVLSDVYVSATIVVVAFGTLEPPSDGVALTAETTPSGLRLDRFVLCVGTIDRRKNQLLLCRVWQRLVAELGANRIPQLVLAGRLDLPLADADPEIAALLASGDILILQGLSDAVTADLYRRCLFTAFPSLSEGYGLPVAESLALGKLCVASDLAPVREQVGDLAWYFPPGDEDAAVSMMRRAITDDAARTAAEARIAARFRHRQWSETFATMARAFAAHPASLPAPAPWPQERLTIPGVAEPALLPTLALADSWCTEDDPEVSILIINWNAYQMTRCCIQQIWANTTGVRYEILIADNGSAALDLTALGSLGRGVRLLPLGTNRFFGEACNIAAEASGGRYLCLLNNDCFGRPGWLAGLVAPLRNDPTVGATGPMFLFPDHSIQEAGGQVDAGGFPTRFGRGERPLPGEQPDYLVARTVDYISAAALLVRKDAFLRAGGFDFTYEPAYYEDTDLCMKLRALGLAVRFCPEAQAIHIEGASVAGDPVAVARRDAMGDLNRGKFVARWGRYLRSREAADLAAIAANLFIDVAPACASSPPATGATAVIYSEYAITPGGGERVFLSIAKLLLATHQVRIVTPHPYSRLRLLNVGHEFGLDLAGCQPQTEAEFLAGPAPDLMVVVGNHIIPPIAPRAAESFFLCQFPFPMPPALRQAPVTTFKGYNGIIAYSEYARAHILAALSAHQLPSLPVHVVYPPVPQLRGRAAAKQRKVLSVGRFFAGGHNKRHDLMIAAFRRLLELSDAPLELHLAGSSFPDPQHMEHLRKLMQMAEGLPVTFHVNASNEDLSALYADAAVYWHATGLASDLAHDPALAEHFGISIVEAMGAECVPIAFNAGGPREIITHGVDGFLYASVEELAELTRDILQPHAAARRQRMGEAAGRRAASFTPEAFAARMTQLVEQGGIGPDREARSEALTTSSVERAWV